MIIEKWYLFAFMLVFYGLVFVWRSYLLWRKTGVNPVARSTGDDVHAFNIRLFKIISLLIWVVIGIYCLADPWYKYLAPLSLLDTSFIQWFGWLLLHFSLIWIYVAQLQMADSWRIGIDRKHETHLVRHGLFRWSHNPIFLGILLANAGLFFVIPNAATLLILGVSAVAMATQIRLEEAFLGETFGEDYRQYLREVRRWL